VIRDKSLERIIIPGWIWN